MENTTQPLAQPMQTQYVKRPKDMTIVWIVNEHGVKSAKYKWLAEQLLDSHPKWNYCEPDPVPAKFSHPLTGGQLTEEGRARRIAADKVQPGDEIKNYTIKELQVMAKEKSINSFGKSKKYLMNALGLNQGSPDQGEEQ